MPATAPAAADATQPPASASAPRRVSIAIKAVNAAKQIVYGVVYSPDRLDSHGEFMPREDVELMAHRFLQLNLAASIDTNHDRIPNGAFPVESFIARAGDPDFAEGEWGLAVHVPDPALWARVEKGELNGFSFEAWVEADEVEVVYEVPRIRTGVTAPAGDPPHTHLFVVRLDDTGKVIGGATSVVDGHWHEIPTSSVTAAAAGHMRERPASPALSRGDGERFRCPAAPLLGEGVPSYDELAAHAGTIRVALDVCRMNADALIELATKPPVPPDAER